MSDRLSGGGWDLDYLIIKGVFSLYRTIITCPVLDIRQLYKISKNLDIYWNFTMKPLARKMRSRKYGFQAGNSAHKLRRKAELHVPEPVSYVRPTVEKFELLSSPIRGKGEDCPVVITDSDGQLCEQKFLRPVQRTPTPLEVSQVAQPGSSTDTNAIYHRGKLIQLFQEATAGHQEFSPGCSGLLDFDDSMRVQRGLAWKESMKCVTCGYQSPVRNIYETVQANRRGPKTAALNYAAQVGLSHTSIASTGLSNILLAMDIPSPSLSGMQKCANKVGDMLVEHNTENMREIRKELQELNTLKGLPASAPVNVEMDGRYNNPIYSAVGNSPFQAATQVSHITVENATRKKYVVDVQTHSKLCQQGELIARTTGHRPCPEHPGCTADLPQSAVIGNEKRWAQDSLLDLAADGLHVNVVTTDPDSSSYRAAVELHSQGELSHEPQHQLDPHHLSRGQRKSVKSTYFSKTMFPGHTAAERKRMQTRLADDIPARCTAEHEAAIQHHAGDNAKVKRAMTFTRDAMVECYQGNHQLCRRYSWMCKARKTKNWLTDSAFLPEGFILSCTDSDKSKLVSLIDYRLGQKVLEKTKFLLSTQKCEATNRAISSTAPKNKTFSRNFPGRVHSAVNAVNHGIGESILSQTQFVGAPVTAGTRVTRGLLRRQAQDSARKLAKKTISSQSKRISKRKTLFRLHETCSQDSGTFYKKNLALKQTVHTGHNDHSYSK